ncbi:diaminopimelate epimerase [Putridiphycobacter roseus]|uniref:Diaminopimelate epimerase n=1 Tax=Putridiphycobacter roseus TaxID=2219161 RepID=A0A2W1N3M5_9FLAO|nr:diaminopimelate epimerase [Putridiphycobacter roseus]PZE17641.1 diaminopimelate epimerase [Putridiphycobacter roseus]
MIKFYKYQGAGNDFVLVDNRKNAFKGDKIAWCKQVCDRKYGIGSDGLIFIENHATYDFKMDFYNPDGSQSFCGNGSRCAVSFAKHIGVFNGNKVSFEAIDGEHEAIVADGIIKVHMQNVGFPTLNGEGYFMDTGSPHFMQFVADIHQVDIHSFGRGIRFDPRFEPNGTNVNIIEEKSKNQIAIRTYERGVEAETLACGTGATACALAFAYENELNKGDIQVKAIGGDLSVSFEVVNQAYENVWLSGPAKFVFEGEMALG